MVPQLRSVPRGSALGIGLLLVVLAGCAGVSDGKLFPIRGEVVAIGATRNEVTLKHEAVAGFMQAMTMPFPVAKRELLDGIAPGDRVEGVLVVEGARYALVSLAKSELPAAAATKPAAS